MKNTYVFGHKNPDTDSIISSIVMTDLEKKMGNENVQACRIGNINKETEYILNYFNVQAPTLIESVTSEDTVILVDHNGFGQSIDGIKDAKILKVVDHHNVSGFETSYPLYYMAQPVGCTATILYELFVMNNYEISKTNAGLLLSAIISDTLLFKSPTCTPKDVKVAEELAKIAEIDIQSYGLDMLKAGTDLSSFTSEELINIDSKEYNFNSNKIQIAQVNTACIDDVLKNKESIEKAINDFIAKNEINLFIFAITDIIENNSQVICLGNRTDIFEKAYNLKLEDNMAFLPGVVSRKKQIVPVIGDNA